jgi:hypothetical protein
VRAIEVTGTPREYRRPRALRETGQPKEIPMISANKMRLRPGELVVLAAPLLWLVPAFVHPDEAGDLFEGIADDAKSRAAGRARDA